MEEIWLRPSICYSSEKQQETDQVSIRTEVRYNEVSQTDTKVMGVKYVL